MDAKISDLEYEWGLVVPMEPSDDQLRNSSQKLEHDIHACETKWSRETRVKDIPYKPHYNTCGDFHQLFPYLWSDLSNENHMPETGNEYWYSGYSFCFFILFYYLFLFYCFFIFVYFI